MFLVFQIDYDQPERTNFGFFRICGTSNHGRIIRIDYSVTFMLGKQMGK